MDHGGSRRVNAFDFGDHVAFKHYFESDAIFRELARFYEPDEYRFEVPTDEFDEVRERLAEWGYDVRVVEDTADYCVVVERYEPHADVLRASVAHWTRRDHEFFLLPDEATVQEAIEDGATPVEATDLAAGV